MALDLKKRQQLGCKIKTEGYGTEENGPWMPGTTVDPSGDVLGSKKRRHPPDDVPNLPFTIPVTLSTSRVPT